MHHHARLGPAARSRGVSRRPAIRRRWWRPVALLLLIAAASLAWAPGASAAGKPSKIASIVEQIAAEVGDARKAGRSARALSNRVIKARRDGAIEVNVWAAGQVGGRERAQLGRLGARIVVTATGPGRRGHPSYGLFHAAVPYDQHRRLWPRSTGSPRSRRRTTASPTTIRPTRPTARASRSTTPTTRRARGINGAGVNVGVISDGVPSLAASDLPAVTVNNTGCGRVAKLRRGHRDARDRPRHGSRGRPVLRRRHRRRRGRPRRRSELARRPRGART